MEEEFASPGPYYRSRSLITDLIYMYCRTDIATLGGGMIGTTAFVRSLLPPRPGWGAGGEVPSGAKGKGAASGQQRLLGVVA